MNLQMTIYSEYILAVLSGHFVLNEAQALTQEVLEACIAHDLRKALFDIRLLIGKPSILDRYQYVTTIGEVQRKHSREGHPVVKTVFLGHEPVIDRERIGELFARNRGAIVKVTSNEAEAWAWLGVTPSSL